jgi:hypothetical protein
MQQAVNLSFGTARTKTMTPDIYSQIICGNSGIAAAY